MLKKIVTAVALVSACGLASSAMAAKALDHGFYVDANLGWSKASFSSEMKDAHINLKDSGFAWGLGGGYKFMPNLAVDFDYLRFLMLKGTDSKHNKTGSVHNNAFILSAKGILPLGGGFSLYGKLGPALLDRTDDNGGDSSNIYTLYAGIGAEYNFTSNMYVGVLGSYFMKRDSFDAAEEDNSKWSPSYWAVTANFGYMF